MFKTLSVLAAIPLAACVTTLDPNYALQVEAYRSTVTAQNAVELEKARAESARYDAIVAIAQSTNDYQTRGMALVALALAGRGGGDVRQTVVNLPAAPETQEARAWKWVALFAPAVSTLAQGYFGYRATVAQTNANRDISMAGFNALGGVARSGFGATQGIATSGFGSIGSLGVSGFSALGARQPSITIGGDGVVGSGSLTGPYSGANSGNSGRINSPNDDHSTNVPPTTVPTPTPLDGSGG